MTLFLPVSSIQIPEDRQRDEIPQDHIEELVDSITSEHGLLNAPTVRNDHKTLVAGECRLAAVREIWTRGLSFTYAGEEVPPGHIPAISLGDVPESVVFQAELEENIRRRDLPWQRRALAINQLESLRRAEAESRGESYTKKDLSKEILGISVEPSGSARQEIAGLSELAAHLDDPEIRKAKTQKEAAKLLAKKKAAAHRARLAEEFGAGTAAVKFPHQIIHGDTREQVKLLPDATFDGIITDPPYGVDANKFSEQGNDHKYEDTEEYALSLYKLVAEEGKRICKPDAHLYSFCDIGLFYKIADIFRASGWTVWYRPLLWYKGANAGVLPAPEYGPRNTYEAILYCRAGTRRTRCVGPDIINIPQLPKLTFGAQKPVALYRELAARSFDPGDKVCDLFAGTGPLFRAGKALSFSVTGVEMSKEKIDYIYATYDEAEG